MTIPTFCGKCNSIIGVEADSPSVILVFRDVECPGRGNHKEPLRTEIGKLFGLIKHVTVKYPETDTESSHQEYVGPGNKVLLRIAIIFGTKRHSNGSYSGVLVNGKWAWWDAKNGLHGEGIKELSRLPR